MDLNESRRFHTERRERAIVATIEKSGTPMLWLDTSIVLDFAKLEKGQAVETVRAKRLARLRAVVRVAVRAEKLICPEWDQSFEYEAMNLERETQRVVSDLSCGAHCIPHAGVKDLQIRIGLKAYLAQADTMHIPASIHFYGDPLEAIREAKKNHYIVETHWPKPAEWIAKAREDKLATREAVEGLRLEYTARAQTFEEQLSLERIGESDAMMLMVGEFLELTKAGKADFWKFMGVQGFLQSAAEWREMSGHGDSLLESLTALFSFMRSPYYWELPI